MTDEHHDEPAESNNGVVLRISDLHKSYGAVRALAGVSLELRRGEVLGLVGDNGAGKSTLVKCISGNITPDSGIVEIDGESVTIEDPQHAFNLGIETVHQDLALVEHLDVASNLFLNREIKVKLPMLRQLGWLDKRRMYEETESTLARLHINIPSVRQTVERLSGGQRQSIAVGKAVAWGKHIVLMDEPSAALGVEQSQLVLDLIRRLKESSVAVLLISHNMQQVVDVCDRVVVLRNGEKVGDANVVDVSPRDLVDLITGATVGLPSKASKSVPGG